MKKRLYFAYGMNTNPGEMYYRCPNSRAIGKASLKDHAFEFRTHANIRSQQDSQVLGVLWEITKTDEDMLDILEGYPSYYTKKTISVTHNDIKFIAMTYVMNEKSKLSSPYESYYNLLAEGYKHFGIDQCQLLDALPVALSLDSRDFD